jgi:hypothetical protein
MFLVNGLGEDPGLSNRDFLFYTPLYLEFKKMFLYLLHQQTMRATTSFKILSYDSAAKTVVGKAN